MIDCDIADRIATVRLANPPVNALSRAWADRFMAVLDELEGRDDWRVLRIVSGLKLFSAGGDIKEFAARLDQADAGMLLSDEARLYQHLFARIERLEQVTIAELRGVAAGGGFEIALACDLRIAGTKARLGLPEVGLGLLPSAGGTQRLTRLVGRGRALRLIACAELVDAAQAHVLGMVEWVLPDEDFDRQALAIAAKLAGQPREALLAAKSCVRAAGADDGLGFILEAKAPQRLMQSSETRARIIGFLDSR